jgi:hypothetical protein
VILSFDFAPNRANLMDWNYDQFVIIRTLVGILKPRHLQIVLELISDVVNLENYINTLHPSAPFPQYLRLLAVRFQDINYNINLWVSLIHDKHTSPNMSEEQIEAALFNSIRRYWNGRGKTDSQVSVLFDEANMSSENFSPLHQLSYIRVTQK